MSRRTRLLLVAAAVGLGANVAAATLVDRPTDDRRRAAAEHDLRRKLVRRGVHGVRVECATGRRCTITRGGASQTVDPVSFPP